MKHNILPLNFLGGLAKSPASVFTTHLLSTNLWRGGERVSYSLDSTGKNELPKCAEEGKDATFCEQRDNVSQKFHIQAILPFLSQTGGLTESNLQTVYKMCWSESHH